MEYLECPRLLEELMLFKENFHGRQAIPVTQCGMSGIYSIVYCSCGDTGSNMRDKPLCGNSLTRSRSEGVSLKHTKLASHES